jgi:hypothetical protein
MGYTKSEQHTNSLHKFWQHSITPSDDHARHQLLTQQVDNQDITHDDNPWETLCAMIMRQHQGQSLNEYVLAISLVLVVALASLGVFAAQNKRFFTHVQQVLMGQPDTDKTESTPSVTQPPTGLPAGTASQNRVDQAIATYAPKIDPSTLPALHAAMNHYLQTSDMEQLIETAGSSGTTNLLLETLVNAGKAKLAEGKITQATLDSIIDLSNKGHRLADVQRIVEQTYQKCNGQFACYKNEYVEYEGFNHLVMNLDDMTANTHGYTQQATNMTQEYGGRLGAAHLIDKPGAHGNWWMKDFLTQWETVQTELQNDSATKALIDRLSLEVAVVNGTANVAINSWVSSEGSVDTSAGYNAMVAKAVSQYNARQTCATGNGKDQVTFCQP